MTQLSKSYWLPVQWDANPSIKAVYTTRFALETTHTILSPVIAENLTDYSEFNLALHVGDDPKQVINNRTHLKNSLELPAEPAWLEQTHSNKVIDLDSYSTSSPLSAEADGSFTRSSAKVCCVMTADCLPILLCNRQGDWVAAVHAGWRGLASGIIENAISKYSRDKSEIIAWLGPAISQANFEVGVEVKQTFLDRNNRFDSAFKATSQGKYLADLYQIATQILAEYGIQSSGGNHCTFRESDKFYSYRRHATTGRMASLIWINKKKNK